ncbi:MAG: AAA family ATPase [Nanoarchaeota archaeon]|nr:AAA family ATPase [Nanoarchaeota archaeon]
MYWYQTLGYEKNPLEVNPLLIDFELTKYYEELDKLTYLLAAGNIVLLKGPDGSGKTALQNELQKRLNKTNKTFYLNARKMSMNKNVEGLLMDQRGFLRKIIGLELNEVILLLDNAEYLTEENTERIKYHYDHNHLKSVLFSTAKEEMLNFTQSMRRRIGTREITL